MEMYLDDGNKHENLVMDSPGRIDWPYKKPSVINKAEYAMIKSALGRKKKKSYVIDRQEVRELLSDFLIELVKLYYFCTNGKNVEAREVIIKNF